MKTNMAIRVKCAFLLFSLVAVITAQDLKCYVCDDCESGYESSLQTCQSESDVTSSPTGAPTVAPTAAPTVAPTEAPTVAPTAAPTAAPTVVPTEAPTEAPTEVPTAVPTAAPTVAPTAAPTVAPTAAPTVAPTAAPTVAPTAAPTVAPTAAPTVAPTAAPTVAPTAAPTVAPTAAPTAAPTTATADSIANPAVENEEIQQQPEVYLARYKRETTSNVTRCVVTSYQGYNKTIVKRGCSFGEMEDETRCRNLIGNNYNETLSRCSICNENGCNSATNLVISFIPFAISVILLKTL